MILLTNSARTVSAYFVIDILMLGQRICLWQAVKILPFFTFSANHPDRRKQGFAQRNFDRLPLGFYSTTDAKIGLKLTVIPRYENSGSVTT